ncbi:MAG: hypothetical protein ACSHXD_20440 [Marinosulfonomonas sp.]
METQDSAVFLVASALASEHEGKRLESLPADLQMKYLDDARWSLARKPSGALGWRGWTGLVIVVLVAAAATVTIFSA